MLPSNGGNLRGRLRSATMSFYFGQVVEKGKLPGNGTVLRHGCIFFIDIINSASMSTGLLWLHDGFWEGK